jgi:phospholipase/carboxylesterase
MVGIEDHGVALDFHDVKDLFPAIGAEALELAPNLDAGWELRARDGADQVLVAQAKRIFRLQRQHGLEAAFLAVKCCLDLWQRVAVATVQINHGLVALLDQLALHVGNFIAEGDGSVFGDFHVACAFCRLSGGALCALPIFASHDLSNAGSLLLRWGKTQWRQRSDHAPDAVENGCPALKSLESGPPAGLAPILTTLEYQTPTSQFSIMQVNDTASLELLTPGITPCQLFVLLHDAGGTAADMLVLGNLLGDAFPEAAFLIPEGLVGPHADAAAGKDDATALAGFGAGASLALSDAHDGLVGRLLSFGGGYQVWPTKAPALTTLHFLHGQNDAVVRVARTLSDFHHLMSLGADATLDVAATLGHELHPALMDQAVMRLKTCVPLRHWKAV